MVSFCSNTSRAGSSLEAAGLWRERQSRGRALLSSSGLRDKAESFCLAPYEEEEVGSAAKSTHSIAACFLQGLFPQERFSLSHADKVVSMSDPNTIFCLVPTHICMFLLKRNRPWSLQK